MVIRCTDISYEKVKDVITLDNKKYIKSCKVYRFDIMQDAAIYIFVIKCKKNCSSKIKSSLENFLPYSSFSSTVEKL